LKTLCGIVLFERQHLFLLQGGEVALRRTEEMQELPGIQILGWGKAEVFKVFLNPF
jgi:hypothetical protein